LACSEKFIDDSMLCDEELKISDEKDYTNDLKAKQSVISII